MASASLGSWLWLHLAFGFWLLACKQTFVGLAWNWLWLHLALGFWLWLHLALGFWPFWFSGLLAFGFTWLYDTLKKSAFGLWLFSSSFVLLAFGSWAFWLFGFWLLACSIRFTSHFAFGLLVFWPFAFGVCERNEDHINKCPN